MALSSAMIRAVAASSREYSTTRNCPCTRNHSMVAASYSSKRLLQTSHSEDVFIPLPRGSTLPSLAFILNQVGRIDISNLCIQCQGYQRVSDTVYNLTRCAFFSRISGGPKGVH